MCNLHKILYKNISKSYFCIKDRHTNSSSDRQQARTDERSKVSKSNYIIFAMFLIVYYMYYYNISKMLLDTDNVSVITVLPSL